MTESRNYPDSGPRGEPFPDGAPASPRRGAPDTREPYPSEPRRDGEPVRDGDAAAGEPVPGRPHGTVPADGGHGPYGTAPADAAGEGAVTTMPRRVPGSRFGGLWVAMTIAAIILLLLLIFILENNDTADVAFFGQHGHLPLGVALLLAAVFGMLIVAVPGYGRIIQLRRAATHPDRKTRPARHAKIRR